MHASLRHAFVGTFVLLVLTAPLATAGNEGLKVSLTAHRVVANARGGEGLRPADQARPGEVVEYQAIYSNPSETRVGKVEATLPIPPGTEYVARTALPAPALASTDGRSFAPVPLQRVVRLPDGRQELRPVPASEYRYLRWALGTMAPGATKTVRARVRVSALTALDTAGR